MGIVIYDGTGSINLTSQGGEMAFFNRDFNNSLPPYPNPGYKNGRTYAVDSGGSSLGAMPNLIIPPQGQNPGSHALVGNRDSSGNDPATLKAISGLAGAEHTLKIVFTSASAVTVKWLEVSYETSWANDEYLLFGCAAKQLTDIFTHHWHNLRSYSLRVHPDGTQGQAATSHTFYAGFCGYATAATGSYWGQGLAFTVWFV